MFAAFQLRRAGTIIVLLLAGIIPGPAQIPDSSRLEIVFVSDTQAPMGIEKLKLKEDHNTLATQMIFGDITARHPRSVFILGDVVSLGKKESKWKAMDGYLAALRQNDIPCFALLGNHDVLWGAEQGIRNFNKRFPSNAITGTCSIVDSVAVVMLNSNFESLSEQSRKEQQKFYHDTMLKLNADPAVKWIIVTCHHAPYTNSTIVSSSRWVQEEFVPLYISTRKAKLFMTGHAHMFEWFTEKGKDFLTIGGGGGLHQPRTTGKKALPNRSGPYDPEFFYITLLRKPHELVITAHVLAHDFKTFSKGFTFSIPEN